MPARPSSRAPALLLHGAYLSRRAWQPQLRGPLAQHFHLLAPDLRGHGADRTPGPYSVEGWAQELLTWLDRLEVEQVHVCGHSLGGMVAQQLALTAPQRVRSLLLVETSYGTRSTPLERRLTDLTLPLLARWPLRGQAAAFALAYAPHNRPLREYVQAELQAFESRPQDYLAIWQAVTAFDSRAQLSRLTVPTRMVVGGRNLQTHAQARAMAALIPGARLEVVRGAGHLVPLERPAIFSALAGEFWLGAESQ